MSDTYTKNEIDLMHKSIDDKLDLILAQTTKHNARMTKVETRQNIFTGGMKVFIAVLMVIILPIMAWALFILTNVNNLIEDTVRDVLPKEVQTQLNDIELPAYIIK